MDIYFQKANYFEITLDTISVQFFKCNIVFSPQISFPKIKKFVTVAWQRIWDLGPRRNQGEPLHLA